HQRPENRNQEKIDDAEPQIEGGGGPAISGDGSEEAIEQQQIEQQEPEHAGQQTRQADIRRAPCEDGGAYERDYERSGKEILQLRDAENRSHGVAQRAKDVIAGEQDEIA